MNSIKKIKKEILNQIEKAVIKLYKEKPKELFLEFPPDITLGDFAVPVFPLAKQLKENPKQTASKIADEIKENKIIQKVEAAGPYLNFKIKNKVLFKAVCSEPPEKILPVKKKKIMVEFLGPNTNKPLHLGHVRNGVLGIAVSNLLENEGNSVIKANIINDRGIHICKSMLAWQKWAKGTTPKSSKMKGDHFVGKWYVRYGKEAEKNKSLEEEVKKLLKKWEERDPKTIKIWKMMNSWVYQGFSQTFKKLGLEFNAVYYESNTYRLGKDIVKKGLKKKIFYKNKKGAIIFDLSKDEFGLDRNNMPKKLTLLRPDGTSLYITQDLGTVVLRFKKHKLDKLIYIVGSEQTYHFRCLFKMIEALDYPWAKELRHLSYGMVYLPEGKMKSREGKVVDADELIEKMEKLAEKEIQKRNDNLSQKEIQKRAEKIGMGAIKFYMLRVKPSQDIHFNPEESISFDGFTGPYCQYAYARTAGILNKVKYKRDKKINFSLLNKKEELQLAQKIIQMPDKTKTSILENNPSILANNVYEIAKIFNQFYNLHPVISANNKELTKARLALVEATGETLKKGLNLLGIDVLKKM